MLYCVQSQKIVRLTDVVFDEGPLLWQLGGNGDQDISSIEYPVEDDEDDEFPGELSTSTYYKERLDEAATTNIAYASIAIAMLSSLTSSNSNPTYKQAVNGPDKEKWLRAIAEEYDAIIANHTWDIVDYTPNLNVLPGKWVLKIKNNGRYKARYVCGGHKQIAGVDYDQVYASVAKTTSFRTMLALAAQFDLEVEQLDVQNAFLNGELHETVYIRLPQRYAQSGKVCKLRKTLYGLC